MINKQQGKIHYYLNTGIKIGDDTYSPVKHIVGATVVINKIPYTIRDLKRFSRVSRLNLEVLATVTEDKIKIT